MPETIGSLFVVKRKANENEIRGSKRLRLIGSYTTKPNEDDIFDRLGEKNINRKRVIIQDFESNHFKKFISELPTKKAPIADDESNDDDILSRDNTNDNGNLKESFSDNANPLLGLNLSNEDFHDAKEDITPVEITCNGEPMIALSDESAIKNLVSGDHMNGENCIYDVYGYYDDLILDFGKPDDDDEYKDVYDYDSDENDENWRGNDYPDDCDSEDEFKSASDHSSAYQDVCSDIDIYDSEIDNLQQLRLSDSEDYLRYDTESEPEL